MGGSKSAGGNGGKNFLGGSTGTFTPGQNFWEFNPRDIATSNSNLNLAAGGARNLGNVGQRALQSAGGFFSQLGGGNANLDQAMNLAGRFSGGKLPSSFQQLPGLINDLRGTASRQVTGANLGSDPALEAARKNFAMNQRGNIQAAAARAGLGRSNTAINAEAMARTAADVPFIQDALRREEAGIGREMSALDRAIGTTMGTGQSQLAANDAAVRSLLSGAGQQSQNLAAAGQGAAGIAGQEFNNALNAVRSNADIGNNMRDINQQILDAPYDEQQRLYAEALNSMYGPLGMIGSLLGGSTSTSKK